MIYKLLIIFCLLSIKICACSTFLFEKEDKCFLAKSYDWIAEDGLVVVNKRHVAKLAMAVNNPMQWVSKYGSVIFTQAGRELPFCGMNEMGLTVELMWLEDTTYPNPDHRKAITDLQWIQYQLDTASSVEEVIASDLIVRIDRSSKSLIHFFVADRLGNCAVIEFIDGKMVSYPRNKLPVPVLTNDTYPKSLEFLNTGKDCEGSFFSLHRFIRIATQLQQANSVDVPSAFRILSSVANFKEVVDVEATFENMELLMRTKWNIVYDITNREIHFLTSNHQKIRIVRLDALNFNGAAEALDVQASLEGDVSNQFVPCTYEINRHLIDCYYAKVPFLRSIPEEMRERIARYPKN